MMETADKTLSERTQSLVSRIGKHAPFVLGAARDLVTAVRGARYRALTRSTAVNPRSALFKAYSGRNYACSPRAIYEAMLADERFDDFELVWVFREPLAAALSARGLRVEGLRPGARALPDVDLDRVFGPEALDALRRSEIVVWGGEAHNRAHARTAYWFCNTVIPWHLATRAGQAYVQAWHGAPLKRLGCDIDPSMANNALYSGRQTHRRYRREGERFTWLLAPSHFAAGALASAFCLSPGQAAEKILELGYPRNDALTNPDVERVAEIKRRLGIEPGRTVVLYAPTWRDDQHSSDARGYTLDVPLDFDRLHAELGDEYVVLFRAHYLIANEFDFGRHDGFVLDVSDVSDVNDLFVASDVLVTDYSSVLFDYANLGRPMVFYMYDLDNYAANMRGFYFDLDELPGPIVRTQADLTEAIRAGARPDAARDERYDRFRQRHASLADGHASQRVIERVILGRTDT